VSPLADTIARMTRIGRGLGGIACAIAILPAGAVAASSSMTPPAGTPTPAVGAPPRPTGTPTTPTTPSPPPAPPPKPARGQLRLFAAGLMHVNSQPVTVTNRAIWINGVMRPYVRGQIVTVHTFIGGRMVRSQRVRVARSRGGTYGHFSIRFVSSRSGAVFVSAQHKANAKVVRLVAHTSFAALHPSASFGSTGRFVQLIQNRLALLHFYIPQTGVYDNGTGLAIDAYHRLRGWGTSQYLDNATISGLLNQVGAFHIRHPGEGKHAEGNLSNQLLALANGSHVYQIYPISSGKPSTPTVLGHFNVYLKDPYYLPDGMYFSSFFYGGYAIHGYDPAPDYPASHGCMRVPIPDAVPIYNWLEIGNGVDVYY
jgi:hypothetical protein